MGTNSIIDTWWKFDFHTHTPASKDHRSNHEEEDLTPRDWLLHFMRKEVDCVAITDHNTGEWIDELKQTYQELRQNKNKNFRDLYLFPGVEITALHDIHILGLFDIACGTHTITSLLKDLGFSDNDFGKKNATTPYSSDKVIEKIHMKEGIAIPAHVDKACGLFIDETINIQEQALNNKDMMALEVINEDFEKPDIYKNKNLTLAEVMGTDSHSRNTIGSNYTLVKMDEPSLDALRLALRDGENRVKRNSPQK